MAEVLGHVPLEDRVKQDPRYASLALLSSPLVETIGELQNKLEVNPQDPHASFWLDYFNAANIVHKEYSAGLSSAGVSTRDHDAYSAGRLESALRIVRSIDNPAIYDSKGIGQYKMLLSGLLEDGSSAVEEASTFVRDLPDWFKEAAHEFRVTEPKE